MIMVDLGTVTERLDKNHYETDEKQSHIEVNQDVPPTSTRSTPTARSVFCTRPA